MIFIHLPTGKLTESHSEKRIERLENSSNYFKLKDIESKKSLDIRFFMHSKAEDKHSWAYAHCHWEICPISDKIETVHFAHLPQQLWNHPAIVTQRTLFKLRS